MFWGRMARTSIDPSIWPGFFLAETISVHTHKTILQKTMHYLFLFCQGCVNKQSNAFPLTQVNSWVNPHSSVSQPEGSLSAVSMHMGNLSVLKLQLSLCPWNVPQELDRNSTHHWRFSSLQRKLEAARKCGCPAGSPPLPRKFADAAPRMCGKRFHFSWNVSHTKELENGQLYQNWHETISCNYTEENLEMQGTITITSAPSIHYPIWQCQRTKIDR